MASSPLLISPSFISFFRSVQYLRVPIVPLELVRGAANSASDATV